MKSSKNSSYSSIWKEEIWKNNSLFGNMKDGF